MAILKLSSPWIRYYRELEAMFMEDPEVKVVYDEEANVVKLYVDSATKAYALDRLLPSEATFGMVKLKIDVIPANGVKTECSDLFEAAFKGNGALSYITHVKGIFANEMTYVVFVKEVVQYFNDDLGDANGVCSTLYQDIAKRLFTSTEGVFFCTNTNGSVALPCICKA